jgi:hypothetical protein
VREEAEGVPHRQRRRVHVGVLHRVLCWPGCGAAPLDASHAVAEWRGGAAQPVGGGNGACPAKAEGHAGHLLGRGGEHGCVPPQPLNHLGPLRQDTI